MTITTTSPGSGRFARFAVEATVLENQRLSPRVALLRLEVPALDASFEPGDKVKLAVPEGKPKSYTPARMRPGQMDVVFDLHGQGPTARWAESAQPGDRLWTTQPLPSLRIAPGRLWFQGDATTLGLALALHEDRRYELDGVVELAEDDAAAIHALGLPLTAVRIGDANTITPQDAQAALLVGEASMVAAGQRTMRALGIEQVYTKPYWSRHGKVHRKWVSMTTGGAQ